MFCYIFFPWPWCFLFFVVFFFFSLKLLFSFLGFHFILTCFSYITLMFFPLLLAAQNSYLNQKSKKYHIHYKYIIEFRVRKKSGDGSCFQKVKSFEYHVIKPTKHIYYRQRRAVTCLLAAKWCNDSSALGRQL